MRRIAARGDGWVALVFLLPTLLGLLVFSLVPLISSFLMSLTSWDGLKRLAPGPALGFIGAGNYADILRGEEFWRVLRNTCYFIVLYIPMILASSLGVGALLSRKRPGIVFFRVLYYIPVLTSWVAGALIWRWFLSPEYGPLNALLGLIGVHGPGWLQDEHWAMPGIVLASIWKDMGFFGLIFLGGLQGINPSYYEAAQIDGAGGWTQFRRITLPLLSHVTFFVVVICVINSFQLFPQVMIMTTGGDAGPHGATQVMVERIYKYAFRYYRMGYATAFSWLLFLIIFSFTWIQLRLQRKWVTYEA
jgi:multiple sugar transport system permease protein